MGALAVIDASVALKWVLPEPNRSLAMTLLRQHLSGDRQLIAPDLLMAEAASTLAKRSRRRTLTPGQAEQAFKLLCQFRVALIRNEELVVQALKVALRHHVSLWDAVYIALAIQEQCVLITADQRLYNAAASICNAVELSETAATGY